MAETTTTTAAMVDAIKYKRCRQKAALEGTDPKVCDKYKAERMSKKNGGMVRAKVKSARKPRARVKSHAIKTSSDHKFSY